MCMPDDFHLLLVSLEHWVATVVKSGSNYVVGVARFPEFVGAVRT